MARKRAGQEGELILARRAIPEWIGKTPDSKAPEHVRLRVFRDWGGSCYITKRKIREGESWHLEHVIAIIDGGENRESNLRPVLIAPHQEKTAREAAKRAKADASAKRSLGIRERPTQPISSRPKPEKEPRDKLPVPSWRSLYVDLGDEK
jgi:5-methylcytosine-specific restriction enzyme A